jgi:hypothetical protein
MTLPSRRLSLRAIVIIGPERAAGRSAARWRKRSPAISSRLRPSVSPDIYLGRGVAEPLEGPRLEHAQELHLDG